MTRYSDYCECLTEDVQSVLYPIQPSGGGNGKLLAIGLTVIGLVMLGVGGKR